MQETKKKTGRKFLIKGGVSLDAISWEVFRAQDTGQAYGSFRLAVGSDFICIHTLDYSNLPDPGLAYIEKLDKILSAISSFRAILGSDNVASMCEWLNPKESGATGCVAFYHDAVGPNQMVFFEISSCSKTVRIQAFMYTSKALAKIDRVLKSIQSELVVHRSTMANMYDAESVNKKQQTTGE